MTKVFKSRYMMNAQNRQKQADHTMKLKNRVKTDTFQLAWTTDSW